MKKLIITITAAIGLAQYAFAANGLWLEKRDGNKIGYLFNEEITISYNSKNVVITTPNISVEYPYNDVRRVYFDNNVTSDVTTPFIEKRQQIRIIANGLELKGYAAGTSVTISNLLGSFYLQRATDIDGFLNIRWRELPSGVYIIKADKTTIKFRNN